jgi:hypothetical protein
MQRKYGVTAMTQIPLGGNPSVIFISCLFDVINRRLFACVQSLCRFSIFFVDHVFFTETQAVIARCEQKSAR